MNKFYCWILLFVFASFSVSAALTDNLLGYWSFDAQTVVDDYSTNDFTNHGATFTASAACGDYASEYDDASSQYMTQGKLIDTSSDYSYSVWFYLDDIASSHAILSQFETSTDKDDSIGLYRITTGPYSWTSDNSGYTQINDADGLTAFAAGGWYNLVYSHNAAGTDYIYLNGAQDASKAETAGSYAASTPYFSLGRRERNTDWYMDGRIDDLAIWTRTLSLAEAQQIYNSGNCYNFLATGPVSNETFEITAVDVYDDSSINVFNATIKVVTSPTGTTYTTTTGNISLNGSQFLSVEGYDIIIDAPNFISHTYSPVTINGSAGIQANITQTEIRLAAYEFMTGNALTGIFLNTTNQMVSPPLYYNYGNHTFTFINSSYLNKSVTFDVPARFNGTLNITNVSSSTINIINITAYNAYSSATLYNFTGYVYNIDEAYNQSFNVTTGYYEALAINGNFTVYLEAPGYAISQTTNWKNITVDSALVNTTFSLWSNNSIRIYLYDEATSLPIIGTNITIVLTGNSSETTYYTTTGFKLVEDVSDGNYTLKFSGGNYTLKTYSVTVADRSTQQLDAYLSSSYQNVIFTLSDQYSLSTIEGASFTASKLINSTYTVVESKSTDVTGRVKISYLPDIKYKYTVTMTGYVTKVFYLDPVIFSSYSVLLTPEGTTDNNADYAHVGIVYYPKFFINNAQNNLTFTFASPSGALSLYGFNITYPGGSVQQTGVNSIGEDYMPKFNITGALLHSTVNVTYWYDTTIGPYKIFKDTYGIYGSVDTLNNTYGRIRNGGTMGLGVLELALIAAFFVMILTGLAFMLGGIQVAGVVFMLSSGLFAWLGFLPLWSILPALLVCFVLVIGGNT